MPRRKQSNSSPNCDLGRKRQEAKTRYNEWHDDYKRIVSEQYSREEWRDSMDKERIIRTEIGLCEEKIVNLADQLLGDQRCIN